MVKVNLRIEVLLRVPMQPLLVRCRLQTRSKARLQTTWASEALLRAPGKMGEVRPQQLLRATTWPRTSNDGMHPRTAQRYACHSGEHRAHVQASAQGICGSTQLYVWSSVKSANARQFMRM